MRNAGRSPVNRKRKGGVKVHTLIESDEDVPCLIRFTSAAAHDSPFLSQVKLPEGSILVFDKGYNDYSHFQRFSDEKVTWVTRKRKNAIYKIREYRPVSDAQIARGIKKDRLIVLGHHHHANHPFVNARLIDFKDPESGKRFQFLTNNTKLAPASIAALYKKQWQIEILFKRFKQNYPLKYFLGDSENAIKIQIWCALICDLLIKIIKSIAGRKWSFSNLVSIIRIQLMTYIDRYSFLRKPEHALRSKSPPPAQGLLFVT
jgi:IS4 transposase